MKTWEVIITRTASVFVDADTADEAEAEVFGITDGDDRIEEDSGWLVEDSTAEVEDI